MRFRLLRRRLTVSAPDGRAQCAAMAIALAPAGADAGVLRSIGAVGFEFGRSIAGWMQAEGELKHLRAEVQRRRTVRTASGPCGHLGSLLLAEGPPWSNSPQGFAPGRGRKPFAARDLGLFEKLIPAGADTNGVAIQGLQAEVIAGVHLRWQKALVIRTLKNAPEFKGQVELVLTGTRRPTMDPHSQAKARHCQLRQYRRLEGMIDLPPIPW